MVHIHKRFGIDSCDRAKEIRKKMHSILREYSGVRKMESGYYIKDLDVTDILQKFDNSFEDRRELLYCINVFIGEL